MKFNDSPYPATSGFFFAGDLGAGDMNRPALADLSGAVCLMDAFGNLAEDDHPVPGGVALFIVDGEREAGDGLVALGVVPGSRPSRPCSWSCVTSPPFSFSAAPTPAL